MVNLQPVHILIQQTEDLPGVWEVFREMTRKHQMELFLKQVMSTLICGSGGTYSKSGNPSSWNSLGNSVNAGTRKLPVLSTDSYNNLYSSSFGGKYNIRVGNSWIGQKTLSGLSTKSKGFMKVGGARNGQYTFAIWEEGNSNTANDNSSDNFDLVFASVSSKGIVGSF